MSHNKNKKEEDKKTDDEEIYDDEEDEEEEDEDLVENRAKPIFIVHLKHLNVPLTQASLLEHKDELASYNSDCILMRDQTEDPEWASCFFGRSADQLMNKALQTLDEWNEDMDDEPIVPVLDYLADIKSYNCDIDSDTLRKAAYFIVNGYCEADDYKDNFPVKDSLVRIISEVEGQKTIKDVLVDPDWLSLDDDNDEWVERMIKEHGIKY